MVQTTDVQGYENKRGMCYSENKRGMYVCIIIQSKIATNISTLYAYEFEHEIAVTTTSRDRMGSELIAEKQIQARVSDIDSTVDMLMKTIWK